MRVATGRRFMNVFALVTPPLPFTLSLPTNIKTLNGSFSHAQSGPAGMSHATLRDCWQMFVGAGGSWVTIPKDIIKAQKY